MLKTQKSIVGLGALLFALSFVSCASEPVDSTQEQQTGEQASPVSNPYLICANRNPGGIGFDFVIDGASGAAYNLDEKTDLEWDLKVFTLKAVTNEGGQPKGKPCIVLYSTVVTAAEVANTGQTGYDAITSITVDLTNSLVADQIEDIDLATIDKDGNGNLFWAGANGLKAQYDLLAVGESWKSPAKYPQDGDELVYIIKTREGNIVKLMVTEFPADNENGYVQIVWELLN